MTELIIGPLLRHVTATSATIWVETTGPCTVEVLGHSTRTFHVAGHHYALVIVRDLDPLSCVAYDVRLDGDVCWPPPDTELPPTVLRTLAPPGTAPDDDRPLRVLFGSCRTAAPHEPPWSLELARDPRGRGVDALYAHARRMAGQPADEWPDLVVLLGDQIYADDSSPVTRARISAEREHHPAHERLPSELVDGFEQFTWLYHESWASPWERWFLSVVPSVMIFDDHEMIDDWNMSDSWVRDIRHEEWWAQHVTGGLMTYWLYQHLGNQAPEDIEADGILAGLLAADDGQVLLREWAERTDEGTPGSIGYRFSFARHLGRTKLVMIDSRNGRVLGPDGRAMIDAVEWAWIVEQCADDVDHLLIGTSLPAFVPGAMHDLEVWNEAVVGGAWGRRPRRWPQRAGEWLRRAADMEDWAAFGRSFDALTELIAAVGARPDAPASICVLSGDIHFSYHAEIHYPAERAVSARVHQLVSSPIRNALRPSERLGMRLCLSRPVTVVGRLLRRSARRPRTALRWQMDHGPEWANCLGRLTVSGRRADVAIEQATAADDRGRPRLDTVVRARLTS